MAAEKQIRIVTMAGGIDVIGTLEISARDEGIAKFFRPCVIQRQMMNGKPGIILVDLMRGGIFAGDYLELNMKQHLWIGRPSQEISSAYQGIRGGIVMPPNVTAAATMVAQ